MLTHEGIYAGRKYTDGSCAVESYDRKPYSRNHTLENIQMETAQVKIMRAGNGRRGFRG